jgi:hypothetical protein
MTPEDKEMFERMAGQSQFKRWLESQQQVWVQNLKQAPLDKVQRAQGALVVIDDLIEKLTKK